MSDCVRLGLFRIIPLHKIPFYHSAGWMVISILGIHSVLMWHCDECPCPIHDNQEKDSNAH